MAQQPNIARSPATRLRSGALAAIAVWLVLGLQVGSGAHASEERASFKVIVHPSNPMSSIEADELRRIFLKQTARWDHGEAIKPVDLTLRSPLRQTFSRMVLARSVQAVRSYWLQRIFTGGHVPPPELPSDDAVVRYVAAERGAVGYVSVTADTASVKTITVN